MHDSSSKHTHRKHAARTTIVGGQPPGNSRELPPVPAGLEELLGLAAASPEFAAALSRDRASAARAAGVELSPSEISILGAVPEPTLALMISRVGTALPQPDRRAFLERAATAMALLVGGTVLGACESKAPPAKKTASPSGQDAPAPPARPVEPDAAAPTPPARPAEPDAAAPAPPVRTTEPDAPAPPVRTTEPDAPRRPPTRKRKLELDVDGGARPDRPEDRIMIGGIQPGRRGTRIDSSKDGEGDTPIGGVRPKRPSVPKTTTGVRPDRR